MSFAFPVQDVKCPDPQGCTVPVQIFSELASTHRLQTVTIAADQAWYRVYDARDGMNSPNPGYGDTRFAPFDSLSNQMRIPTLYLAESLEGALLETSLHDIHTNKPRVLLEQSLVGKLYARISPPQDLELVDLRDERLSELQLSRENLSSSSSEHYPCTRQIARLLHHEYINTGGILWHSRQAELSGMPQQEVIVLFADRIDTSRSAWKLRGIHGASGSLLEGSGRLTLDRLAERLDIEVMSSN